jgi:hypothetical protein
LSIGKVSSTIIFILVCSWRLVSMSVYHHWLCFSSQTEKILFFYSTVQCTYVFNQTNKSKYFLPTDNRTWKMHFYFKKKGSQFCNK